MPQGLQVFDAAGNIMLDLTTRVGKALGTVSITGANPSGTRTDANFALGTPWFVIIGMADQFGRPDVSFASNTMTWTAVDGFVGTLLYGIY